MKLRKVKWDNHPILQNLELNFINETTNTAFQTIFLIGENGCGKTTVMESLSEFLCGGAFSNFEFIEYEINETVFKAQKPHNLAVHQIQFTNEHSFEIEKTNSYEKFQIRGNNSLNFENDKSEFSLRNFGTILSKARSDFRTGNISSPQSNDLDKNKKEKDIDDSFLQLKQLIVDIYVNDQRNNSSRMEKRPNEKTTWDEFYSTSKIARFRNAFNQFFEDLKFDTVTLENEVLFTKNGKEIKLDRLSTGEKQIVFRGIHLLKNKNLMENSTIFIDEPELSMHPKWQERIIEYFKNLFRFDEEIKAQLFFATHSDHVLKGAFSNLEANQIIRLNNNEGKIESEVLNSPAFFPIVTLAATKYFAYNICTNDFHIELISYIQDKIKEKSNPKKESVSLKETDIYILDHDSFDDSCHEKESSYGSTKYKTLPILIRNRMHHPSDNKSSFTESELKLSTELLLEICRSFEIKKPNSN